MQCVQNNEIEEKEREISIYMYTYICIYTGSSKSPEALKYFKNDQL